MFSLIRKELQSKLDKEKKSPLQISIMGQTGVGKSSLINALFNTNLKTNDVLPTTKSAQKIECQIGDITIWFYDLPGIGESSDADEQYLELYREHLVTSDIVIWAIHADSRSITYDKNSLIHLLDIDESQLKTILLSKITFVLTKADLLSPPKWIAHLKDEKGVIEPTEELREKIQRKESYIQNQFLSQFGSMYVAKTYREEELDYKILPESKFKVDKTHIHYNGLVTFQEFQELKTQFPEFTDPLDRLYNNSKPLVVSSLYKYNLIKLMTILVSKINGGAIVRLPLVNENNLYTIDKAKILNYQNIRIKVATSTKGGK
ncbi:MAG: GTPase [Aggregatilineales bacterium]